MKYLKTYEKHNKLIKKITYEMIVDEVLEEIKSINYEYDKDKVSKTLEELDINRINKAISMINLNKELFCYYPAPIITTMSDLKSGNIEQEKIDIYKISSDVCYSYLVIAGKKWTDMINTDAISIRFKLTGSKSLELNQKELIELAEEGSTIEMDGEFIASSENKLYDRLKKEHI